MKKLLFAMTLFLAGAACATPFGESFREANAAYDAGRYTEAIQLYETLLGEGVDNIEVHYNLANACFKNGDLPKAVWHYRKAWYGSPRDPDIRANLHFALNAAGAVDPKAGITDRFFQSLSHGEWVAVATASYVLIALLLLLALFILPARRTLLRLSLVPAGAILLAAGGLHYWQQMKNHPEWVVVHTGSVALFGPIEGSTAHYEPPQAALVRQTGADPKGWTEVEYDGKRGWVRNEDIHPVSP